MDRSSFRLPDLANATCRLTTYSNRGRSIRIGSLDEHSFFSRAARPPTDLPYHKILQNRRLHQIERFDNAKFLCRKRNIDMRLNYKIFRNRGKRLVRLSLFEYNNVAGTG